MSLARRELAKYAPPPPDRCSRASDAAAGTAVGRSGRRARAAAIALRIRCGDTGLGVPIDWANSETRSSSSIQRTSASASRAGAVGGHRRQRLLELGLQLLHLPQVLGVAVRVGAQHLHAAQQRAQVALDVGQPGEAGVGDEARPHQPGRGGP